MDQNLSFTQNLDALFTNLEDFTKKESVLGSPVVFGDKTLIPVVSVTLGYGSGLTPSTNQQNGTNINSGGGLGLGARISTEAVVVIDQNNVNMLQVNQKSNLGSMMDKIPQAIASMNQNNQNQSQNQNQQQNQQNSSS
ncbi:MAG: GerW family sporulation protein [Deltaproteobacteria bacterium]